MALWRIQAPTILCWAIVAVVGYTFFKLGILPSFLPIFLHDLLCATSDGFRS
jgi:hypothetical protein